MELVEIKPPNSSHSAGKLMHQNYVSIQAKENYTRKGIDNFGMLSLFESKKNHKRLHISTSVVLQIGNTGFSWLCIFSATLSLLLFSISSILKELSINILSQNLPGIYLPFQASE